MQKTALDRWLQKKLVYVSQVYCNTLPHQIPQGATLEETTAASGGRYLYRFTVTTDQAMDELTANLEVANITYTSRIAECGGWKGKLFNNPDKSFTLQVSWVIFGIAILSMAFSGLPVHLWKKLSAEDPPDEKKAEAAHVESARLPG
ncbi:MAG: hypothetical protein WD342_09695 [Verrucomicrobiales bacterium]